MYVCVLSSGSSGNSIYIECRGTAVLIDQGLANRELKRRMSLNGLDTGKIKAILVTHEHGDHISGAGITARDLDVPIYCTEGTMKTLQNLLKGDEKTIRIEGGKAFSINNIEFSPYSVSHDALEPVQFSAVYGKKKFTIATDLGFVSNLVIERLTGSDLAVIESNYDEEMLKNGSYRWELKQRIMGKNGHLSNRNASDLIFNISSRGTGKFVLAHLSEENNKPEIAEKTVKDVFDKYDKKLEMLLTAGQYEPTEIIEL